MKISDPIGKVYQHSMFKKKSYNIPKGGDGDILDRNRSPSDDEDDDDASDISDRSDDSLSTKSSRIIPSRRARTRSTSRRRTGRDEEDPGERDREDAISYASRRERGDHNRSSSRRGSKRTSTKKYGLENLGPPGTSYSLWTTQKSLKRDHKRKFNRSMCGVLLGVSIVLVVLGILGIIGIAVYLGVVQKIESPEKDLVSIDGAFRVVSEDFSLSLLNPASLDYKEQEDKFTNILEKTFRKSYLKDALVKIVIDGFSSGSIKVFFKVILDKSKLPERVLEDPVMAAKDVMMQEVMSLDRSEFSTSIIDIDSIAFSLSKIQDVAKKYLEPEPYQGDKQPEEVSDNNIGGVSVNSGGGGGGSLWQNLAQSTQRSVIRQDPVEEYSENSLQNWPPAANDRVDTYDSFEGETPLNANGWSLPKYPMIQYDGGRLSNLVPNQYPTIVTPQSPVIISPNNGRPKFPANNLPASISMLSPVSPSYPPSMNSPRFPLTSENEISSRRGPAIKNDLMSEYLEPPPPPSPATSRSATLNLEDLFKKQTPPPSSPMQSMSPSEMNFMMTPKPQQQTQNRRIDPEEDYSEKYNGFWNMVNKKNKPPLPQDKQFNNRMSTSMTMTKEDRILSMQDELEHLLMLESQQNSGGPSLYDQIQLMDDNEIKQLADSLVPLLEPQNNNQPNYQVPAAPTNKWRAKPSKNPDPVSINNFGSSGLKTVNTGNGNVIRGSSTTNRPTTVMDIHVPQGQDTGFFGVGSSLSFSGGDTDAKKFANTNTIMNSVGSLNSDQLIRSTMALGSDPNIVYPQQIRGGTQLMQGPQGPIVSSPRPQNLAVPQTPLAPQLPNPGNFDNNYSIIQKLGSQYGRTVAPGNQHHLSGGSRTTTRRPGSLSSSGSQHLVSAVTRAPSQRHKHPSRSETVSTSNRRAGGQQQSDIIGNILPAAIGLSSSAGISPIGIFSNLLNAYATIDSKHDLTGKLINSAASWLQPPTAEVRTTDVVTATTTPDDVSVSSSSSSTTVRSVKRKEETTTARSERPVTNVSVRVNEEKKKNKNQYQSIFDKIRAAAQSQESEYDIVTNYDTDLPPVKSNLFSDGPLRPKPPSEEIIQVSPAPHDYNKEEPAVQFGVSNPQWYSNEIQASTAGYGPDDFIVETVNLDKNFFYQFFTSKPMIIDTDVVTSTSVKVKYDAKPKKGRDTETSLFKSSRETLMNLPEHLIGKEILPDHILKRTGVALDDDQYDVEDEDLTIVKASDYKRYNLPAEIQITSGSPFRNGKEIETGSDKIEKKSDSETS